MGILRWVLRSGAANSYKNKCQSESSAASSSAKDAIRKFDYAKRERDSTKQMTYMAEGLTELAKAVERTSNTVEPLAQMALIAALLSESIDNGLEAQTKEIGDKQT